MANEAAVEGRGLAVVHRRVIRRKTDNAQVNDRPDSPDRVAEEFTSDRTDNLGERKQTHSERGQSEGKRLGVKLGVQLPTAVEKLDIAGERGEPAMIAVINAPRRNIVAQNPGVVEIGGSEQFAVQQHLGRNPIEVTEASTRREPLLDEGPN
ncbi:hypothetical protein ACYX8G_01555 [Microbacterium saperdae]